ncbi:MAG: hypothetical protein KC457_31420, partial [Myxococcales bacterium]|nr:hypothetical protein [Myxococcales bacterium]
MPRSARPLRSLFTSPVSLLALALAFAPIACGDDGGGGDELGDGSDTDGTDGSDSGTETDTGGPDRDALIAELSAPGPYAAGYRELDLSYLPPGEMEERVLPVRVWYPAAADSGAGPVTYTLAGIVQLPSPAALDNPPVAADGPFPVVVYTHGSGGDGLLAYPYAERFASHGWVVFSPSHTGNTASDAFSGQTDSFLKIAVRRPLDVRAVLDEADKGFAGDEVAAATDMSRVFLFGHSFGGYTTFVVGGAALDYQQFLDGCVLDECDYLAEPEVIDAFAEGFADPRIDAIAPQAPVLIGFAEGTLAQMPVPAMLQSGAKDITTPDSTEAIPAWEELANPEDRWIHLLDGAHYSFITVCDDLDPELLNLF